MVQSKQIGLIYWTPYRVLVLLEWRAKYGHSAHIYPQIMQFPNSLGLLFLLEGGEEGFSPLDFWLFVFSQFSQWTKFYPADSRPCSMWQPQFFWPPYTYSIDFSSDYYKFSLELGQKIDSYLGERPETLIEIHTLGPNSAPSTRSKRRDWFFLPNGMTHHRRIERKILSGWRLR